MTNDQRAKIQQVQLYLFKAQKLMHMTAIEFELEAVESPGANPAFESLLEDARESVSVASLKLQDLVKIGV